MRRTWIAPALALLVAATPAPGDAQCDYPLFEWLISASATNPSVGYDPPANGPRTLYLWYSDTPLAAKHIVLSVTGTLNVLSVDPTPGFTITGEPMDFMLVNPQCYVVGPVVVAEFLVEDYGGTVCFSDSVPHCTFTCYPPFNFENSFSGFTSEGSSCSRFVGCIQECGEPVSVEPTTWGRMKGRYRTD